jgi:hypothetical protein
LSPSTVSEDRGPGSCRGRGAVAVIALGHVPVGSSKERRTPSKILHRRRTRPCGPGRSRGKAGTPGRSGRPASVDGVVVAVLGSDALEQEIPLSRLASPHDAVLHSTGPPLPFSGQLSGATSSTLADGVPHTLHGGVTTIALAIWARTRASRSRSQARACTSSPLRWHTWSGHISTAPSRAHGSRRRPAPTCRRYTAQPLRLVGHSGLAVGKRVYQPWGCR